MPAAQAVDYVKCEAIQKALVRVTAGAKADWEKLFTSHSEAAGCMDMSDRRDQLLCQREVLNSDVAFKRAIDELGPSYEKKLAKIQADYEAEGCF